MYEIILIRVLNRTLRYKRQYKSSYFKMYRMKTKIYETLNKVQPVAIHKCKHINEVTILF